MPKIMEESQNGHYERLAINLYDLDRLDSFIRETLLAGKVRTDKAITINKDRPDETAVEFSCDLKTASSICDIIRDHDRKTGDYPTRIYIFRESVWSYLSGEVILSLVVNGSVVLNDEVFSSADSREKVAVRDINNVAHYTELKGKIVTKKGWQK